MKTNQNKIFYKIVDAMTNHQRNLWARAGYPGLVHKEVDVLTKWQYDQEHQEEKHANS